MNGTVREAVLRAHRLAWDAKTEERRRAAWYLCWQIAVKGGIRAAGPGGIPLPHNRWLLPPWMPFRTI